MTSVIYVRNFEYKHTTGTFNLELSWHPMPSFITGKLTGVQLLADKNGVKLMIEDNPLLPYGLDFDNLVPEGTKVLYVDG